jgi:hypothetical protein
VTAQHRPTDKPSTEAERRDDEARDDSVREDSDEREREALNAQLDEELDDSFPASDPPSLTQEPR